jgi:type IV fimbrial biogenesis protein FimT
MVATAAAQVKSELRHALPGVRRQAATGGQNQWTGGGARHSALYLLGLHWTYLNGCWLRSNPRPCEGFWAELQSPQLEIETMNPEPLQSLLGRSRGFTLIEMMVVIGVLAVLMAFSVPAFRDLSLGSSSVSQSNRLLGNLNTARAEAVKTSTNVRITAVGGAWENGWVIATDRNLSGTIDGDDVVLHEGTKAAAGFLWTVITHPGGGALTQFVYAPSGALTTPNAGVLFKLKRPDVGTAPEKSKCIVIEASGRAEVQKGSSSVCAAI